MKAKVARICLGTSIFMLVLGASMLGPATEWAVIAAVFGLVAAIMGARQIRVAALVVMTTAVLAVFSGCNTERKMNDQVRSVRQNAGTTEE